MKRTAAWAGLLLFGTSAMFVIWVGGVVWAPEPIPQGGDSKTVVALNLMLFETFTQENGLELAGVLTTSGRVSYHPEEPDGIEWANLFTRNQGRVWDYAWRPGLSTNGATDSLEDCKSETATMCADAGHGGSENATLTQHAQEDGGGCTCGADCTDGSGAQAFVTSESACG